MGATRFPVPNWAQALIAMAVGLDPNNIAVRLDDDSRIVFLQYMPRAEYCVDKKTGTIRPY